MILPGGYGGAAKQRENSLILPSKVKPDRHRLPSSDGLGQSRHSVCWSFGAAIERRALNPQNAVPLPSGGTDDWGNLLVAKVLLPQGKPYEQVRDEWLHEFKNLVQLRHPNVTYVHQAFEYRDTFYLIIERCDMSLMRLITGPNVQGDLWQPRAIQQAPADPRRSSGQDRDCF